MFPCTKPCPDTLSAQQVNDGMKLSSSDSSCKASLNVHSNDTTSLSYETHKLMTAAEKLNLMTSFEMAFLRFSDPIFWVVTLAQASFMLLKQTVQNFSGQYLKDAVDSYSLCKGQKFQTLGESVSEFQFGASDLENSSRVDSLNSLVITMSSAFNVGVFATTITIGLYVAGGCQKLQRRMIAVFGLGSSLALSAIVVDVAYAMLQEDWYFKFQSKQAQRTDYSLHESIIFGLVPRAFTYSLYHGTNHNSKGLESVVSHNLFESDVFGSNDAHNGEFVPDTTIALFGAVDHECHSRRANPNEQSSCSYDIVLHSIWFRAFLLFSAGPAMGLGFYAPPALYAARTGGTRFSARISGWCDGFGSFIAFAISFLLSGWHAQSGSSNTSSDDIYTNTNSLIEKIKVLSDSDNRVSVSPNCAKVPSLMTGIIYTGKKKMLGDQLPLWCCCLLGLILGSTAVYTFLGSMVESENHRDSGLKPSRENSTEDVVSAKQLSVSSTV